MRSSLPYISYSTKIRQLVEAGIVPDWIYRDCRLHGMDTAEDFLCEWDWEWGWDLGYGYTDSKLAILKKARETVKQGIEEFLRSPQLQAQQKAKEDAQKRAEQLDAELTKKLCPPFYVGEIWSIVQHVMKYGEEPLFRIFYCWFKRHRHSDRNKIRFFMAGVYDGQTHTPKEALALKQSGELKEKYGIETQFSLGSIRHAAKTRYEIRGRLSYLIPALKFQLAEYLRPYSEEKNVCAAGLSLGENIASADTALSADTPYCEANTNDHSSLIINNLSLDSPVWEDIKQRENTIFDNASLLRSLLYFLQE